MSKLTASHGLTLSEKGLKLIKAYEGFRPVDRMLINGQRVVGYGHRLYDERPMRVSKAEAEKLLRNDLEAFEDMVNENTHTPLTQGQFDALVSLAFNIGPKAFLKSDTLRALNNGRPLDAANGFDIWRKSVIDGKTYVVDALMRRRTAEKALFLKTSNVPQPAAGVDLPPVRDEAVALLSTEDALPVFTDSETNGLVANVPLDEDSPTIARRTQSRRRGDGPAGVLVLSEIFEDENEVLEETNLEVSPEEEIQTDVSVVDVDEIDAIPETPTELSEDDSLPTSIIAEAAADISERLDALIESVEDDSDATNTDWADTLEPVPEPPKSNLVAFPSARRNGPSEEEIQIEEPMVDQAQRSQEEPSNLLAESDVDVFIDNLVEDDAARASETIQNTPHIASTYQEPRPVFAESTRENPEHETPDLISETERGSGYWAIVLLGFGVVCFALGLYFFDFATNLGDWGPSLMLSCLIAGSLMVLAGVYYAVKNAFSYG